MREMGQPFHERVRRYAVRIDEREKVYEVFGSILDRCAGQGPTATPPDAAHGLGRLGVAVLDSLGLIQDNHIETHGVVVEPSRVACDQLIIHELKRAIRDLPTRSAGTGVAADHLERQIGRPRAKFPAPVRH